MNNKILSLPVAVLALLLVPCVVQETSRSESDSAISLEPQLVLRIVGPNGEPVVRAKVGTGINVFENSKKHPPQTIVMWLWGNRRQRPFRSDSNGKVVLTGPHAGYRQFYVLHEALGWVGYRRLEQTPADREVEIRLEPACNVYGRLTSSDLERPGHRLLNTSARLHDAQNKMMMYFVSEWGEYEFLLPTGEYKINAYGTGLNGAGTKRLEKSFEVKAGQRQLDLGLMDLPATKLSMLFGKAAPELEGIADWDNGEPVTLAQLRGKVVVLEFWGYWCGPCLQTMPKLMEVYDTFKDKDVVIIAVHEDSRVSTVAELEKKLVGISEKFWGGRDLPFLIAIDSGAERGATHEAYHINKWPTTLVVDREGKLVGEFSPWWELQDKLPELLGEPASPPRNP